MSDRGSALVVIQTARGYQDNDACAVCRSAKPHPTARFWIGCQVCGVGFHDVCYWRDVVTLAERAAWIEDGVLDLFLCHGCRS